LIHHQRYAHAKQFNRIGRALRTLRTQLGRMVRDIGHKTGEHARPHEVFAKPLTLAALSGNPYDGHTPASAIPAITEQIGVSLTRVFAGAGYRGHNTPPRAGMRIYTSG
jgi:hypothetical protein